MEPLHVFEPTYSGIPFDFAIALAVGICAGIGGYFVYHKEGEGTERTRQQLGSMLLFFVALMSFATAFFSFWNSRRIGTLKIYTDRVESGFGTSTFKEIKGAYLKIEDRNTLFPTPQNTSKDTFLIIEEKSGRSHVFGNDSYDVLTMVKAVRATMERK